MIELWNRRLRDKPEYETYNFDLGEKIAIVTTPLFYFVFYLRIPFMVAYFKYPSAAKYFIYLQLV